MSTRRVLSSGNENSRRPLPFDDPSIDSLKPHARESIGDVWQGRAASELAVRSTFVLIREGFERLRPSPTLDAVLASAIDDEARHSSICGQVAHRYLGISSEPHETSVEPLVRFGDADVELSLVLHLVLLSCVNESTSTFYLRDAMQNSRARLARSALRELLADDVEHARIGWAYLASSAVNRETKRHVERALPTLLRLSCEAWTRVRRNDEPWFRDHGCPGLAVARAAFEHAVPAVILPGMAAVGIDPESGARWFSENVGEPPPT